MASRSKAAGLMSAGEGARGRRVWELWRRRGRGGAAGALRRRGFLPGLGTLAPRSPRRSGFLPGLGTTKPTFRSFFCTCRRRGSAPEPGQGVYLAFPHTCGPRRPRARRRGPSEVPRPGRNPHLGSPSGAKVPRPVGFARFIRRTLRIHVTRLLAGVSADDLNSSVASCFLRKTSFAECGPGGPSAAHSPPDAGGGGRAGTMAGAPAGAGIGRGGHRPGRPLVAKK